VCVCVCVLCVCVCVCVCVLCVCVCVCCVVCMCVCVRVCVCVCVCMCVCVDGVSYKQLFIKFSVSFCVKLFSQLETRNLHSRESKGKICNILLTLLYILEAMKSK
jgi:hypothetical protein